MSKNYQWFLVRGKISLWRQAPHVVIELDPEGSAYCVLSEQDASEIAEIIAEEAQTIWAASEQSPSEPARIEGDVHTSCRLWAEPGILEIIAHDSEPLIALVFDSNAPCKLDLTRAVALVQVLRYMSDAMKRKPLVKPGT